MVGWKSEIAAILRYMDLNGDNNWEISPFPILQVKNPPSDHDAGWFLSVLRPMGNPI